MLVDGCRHDANSAVHELVAICAQLSAFGHSIYHAELEVSLRGIESIRGAKFNVSSVIGIARLYISIDGGK
eukprot:scaffold485742_cov25-Prasinocladus_malaysianus.AAC.1